MIQQFLKLRTSELHAPYFLTLTYHHGHERDGHSASVDRNLFLTNLRQQYPGCQYIWRIEPQRRGAPHFHVIVWFQIAQSDVELQDFTAYINRTWHRIADPNSAAHEKHGVRVDRASSYRKAFIYLTKYTAKDDDKSDWNYQGRRWAASRDLPTSPVACWEATPAQAWMMKRILRKLVSKRSKSGQRFARNMRWKTGCLVSIEMLEAWRLADLIAEIRPPPDPAGAWMERIPQIQSMLDLKKQQRRKRFAAFAATEASLISA